jgi:hypothetical protein
MDCQFIDAVSWSAALSIKLKIKEVIMSETDNKLCPMCNIILELLKQKEYLLSETLAKHKNITLYEHMRESTSLEE